MPYLITIIWLLTPSTRSRNASWNPPVTAMTLVSAITPKKTPTIAISVIVDKKLWRRLCRCRRAINDSYADQPILLYPSSGSKRLAGLASGLELSHLAVAGNCAGLRRCLVVLGARRLVCPRRGRARPGILHPFLRVIPQRLRLYELIQCPEPFDEFRGSCYF